MTTSLAITFLGDYPNNSTVWSDDSLKFDVAGYKWENGDFQGVTHDDKNWFMSTQYTIFKMPVELDLKNISFFDFVKKALVAPIPKPLRDLGYNHFGDFDHHAGFLFVPLEGRIPPALAVFRASDLSFVGWAELDQSSDAAGWCAFNPLDKLLYTSGHLKSSNQIHRYRVEIEESAGRIKLTHVEPFGLFKRVNDPLIFGAVGDYIQGGTFSPDGHLFLSCGSDKDHLENEGILVFDRSGLEVARSSCDAGPFRYCFEPGLSLYQEPEGITIWDVPGGTPGINGQLHAILFENAGDEIYFKHYTIDPFVTPRPIVPSLSVLLS